MSHGVDFFVLQQGDEAWFGQAEGMFVVLQPAFAAEYGIKVATTGHGKRGYDAVSDAVNHILTNKNSLFYNKVQIYTFFLGNLDGICVFLSICL